MRNNTTDVARWMGRLLLTVCLVVSAAAAALAFDITGTVYNPTGKTGRIYLSAQNAMFNGGDPVAGVSIASASPDGTPYTIRGLTDPGNYFVYAFMDTQDTAVRHANDPIANSGVFASTASSGRNLTLALPSPAVTLLPPYGADVIYGDTTATIFYDGASDNGNPIATSFNVYWSTTPRPGPSQYVQRLQCHRAAVRFERLLCQIRPGESGQPVLFCSNRISRRRRKCTR